MTDDPFLTRSLGRRTLIVGGAMTLTAAAAYAATPRRSERRLASRKLGELVATRIGPWSVTNPAGVIVASEEIENKDGYDQLLTRVYQGAGMPSIMLLIAYGSTQGGTLQLHRPETCYPGQGFGLRDFDELDFAVGTTPVRARRFTATRDDRVERVLYWTRIGRRFPMNTAQEYGAIIASVLQGLVPDGILVRVSTVDSDTKRASAAIETFARQMIDTASPVGKQVMVGA